MKTGLRFGVALPAALALLGTACMGDGLEPPYTTADLNAAGIPLDCTAADLALADALAPVADDPALRVALGDGQVLCRIPADAPALAARFPELGAELPGLPEVELGTPPAWGETRSATTCDNSGGNAGDPVGGGLTMGGSYTKLGDKVKDPTPQPATPAGNDIALGTPPVRPGTGSGSDND